MKIWIWDKIVGKSWSMSTFSENFDLVNIFGNLDLGQNLKKILALVKMLEKCQFGSKFANISILVEIFENLDFSQIF